MRAKHESVVPTTLGEERLYNPFLRAVDGTLTVRWPAVSPFPLRHHRVALGWPNR